MGARQVAVAMVIGAGLTVPATAEAQAPGLRVVPSFTAAGAYDDNIFFTPGRRERGLFARLTPALRVTYRPTAKLALQGGYSFASEIFPDHPSLNQVLAQQRAAFDARYRAGRRTFLALGAHFEDTQAASELIEDTGIAFGRLPAQRYQGSVSLERGVTAGGTLKAGYAFEGFFLEELGTSRQHSATLGWAHRLRARTSVSLDYRFEQFDFPREDASRSHVLLAGWAQRLGKQTTLSIRGGGRMSERHDGAEGGASLERRFRKGTLSLAYARERNLALSRAVDTESLVAAASCAVGRSMVITASPGVYRNRLRDEDITSYRASVGVGRRLGRWLALHGVYQFLVQEGRPDLGIAGRGLERVSRNVFLVGFTAGDGRSRVN